ncbi:diaminopimelate decarboxylase, aspartate kinase (fusion of lysA and lysC) [Legionella parisiensis]|uniref:Diaminopimelate decarboxylase n=1 Tax=Legionella parisiensis TaxID=45071 RepID=A0A1E5JL71_9GAMM|nr:diaminopimelate decarboxylase, aspartate kinase (fusion of lysA and lysC) [Legionella parisiensis]OEH45254.1 Diaminopimelate decarboxylase [Legionella parisiensis]STX76021.1 diaminopimelate decarboxylase, aspartate kinase (fusion of lysA and lysC) [Legionella parisiensis]
MESTVKTIMSPKSRIINALTLCLQQKSNKDFKLNKSTAYTGLTDLYEHYALENNTDQFFEAFEQLCKITHDYQLGDNPILDNFIIQLEKVFHPQKLEKGVTRPTPWWQIKKESLLSIAGTHSPCYVYNSTTQITQAKQLLNLKSIDTLFYAIKANSHPSILKTLEKEGIGFECVSIQELKRISDLFPDIDKKRILFTPNFAPKAEYEFAMNLGCYVTIDNLHPLISWTELFQNRDIIIRIDPGAGAGHHKHVITGGNESKFGIDQKDIEHLKILTQKNNVRVIGLHSHSGSGILTPELWEQTALMLTSLIEQFPNTQFINLGGGLGIVEKPGQKPLNLQKLDARLLAVKSHCPHLKFWMEPGRFFVAESGVILAKVTQCKEKGEVKFIGIETGMNSLIRPSLYGAYHEIVNLSRLHEDNAGFSHVVGPICESGDTLGYDRLLPATYEGDIILIANTGAYGYCMSSHYNLRSPAHEIILEA